MEISESFQENNITKLTAIQPSNSKVQYGYKNLFYRLIEIMNSILRIFP